MAELRLVLDTHVWLWAVSGDKTLRQSARDHIRRAVQSGVVLIPSISVWELSMLWKRNRIQISQPIQDWITEALDRSGFVVAPLSPDVAVDAATLPGKFHSDPADCMIVATARINKAILLTRDSRIIEYARFGHINVVSV